MRSGLLTLRAAGLVAAMVAVPVLGTTAADAHDSVKATVTPSPVRPGGEVRIRITGCENPRAAAARSDVFVADSELGARGGDRKPPLQGEAKVKSSAKDGRYAVDVWCDGHEHPRAAVFEVDRNPNPKPKASAKTSAPASAKPKPKPKTSPSAKPKPKPKPKTSASESDFASASPKPKPKPKPKPEPESKTSATATASARPAAKPRPTSAKPSAKPSAKSSAKPEAKPRPARSGRHPESSQPRSSSSRSSQAQAQPQAQAHPDPGQHRASPVAPVRAGGGGRTISTAAADEAGPSTPHTVIGLVLAGVAAVAVAIRSARRKRSAARDSD